MADYRVALIRQTSAPPSRGMCVPVMCADAGAAKNNATYAPTPMSRIYATQNMRAHRYPPYLVAYRCGPLAGPHP